MPLPRTSPPTSNVKSEVEIVYKEPLSQSERAAAVRIFKSFVENNGTIAESTIDKVLVEDKTGEFVEIDVCTIFPCPEDMVCEIVNGVCTSTCENNMMYCLNSGVCVARQPDVIECLCPELYSGNRCQIKESKNPGLTQRDIIGIVAGVLAGVIILFIMLVLIIKSHRVEDKEKKNKNVDFYELNLYEGDSTFNGGLADDIRETELNENKPTIENETQTDIKAVVIENNSSQQKTEDKEQTENTDDKERENVDDYDGENYYPTDDEDEEQDVAADNHDYQRISTFEQSSFKPSEFEMRDEVPDIHL
ncbi:uncharacterized protein LOC100366750 [Saccoglossus kowalevskii]